MERFRYPINLGIDVENGAQARIVFNRKVSDEIVGNATSHLDLEVNDFEQLDMTGNLEITEGAYHFTLQNWFNSGLTSSPEVRFRGKAIRTMPN